MRLAVGLNALFLHYPHSGTGRYLTQLSRLARTEVDLTLFGSTAFPPVASAAVPEVRLLSTPFDLRSRTLAKVWFEQLALPRAMRRANVVVAHSPYFAPPLRPLVPTVVTVHDLATVVLPEYRRLAAQRFYASLVSIGLKSARGIITDSAASARDLTGKLGIPPEKIRVIPLAVDARFRPLERADELGWAAEIRAKYDVQSPYLLYVGSFERRKNVDRLVGAFAQLRRDDQLPHQLVLVGARRPGHASFYDPLADIERLGLGSCVKLVGALGDEEVVALQSGAQAFVFPSLYEGFGLPPLEAMACGTPVVCSNASSLPEVVGNAGILFDPTSIGAIADAIREVVGDRDRREWLGQHGRERAKQFTWEATTEATIAVYHAVARELK